MQGIIMLKKKCSDCAEKIDKKFSYCPWCGASIKKNREREDFGLLGRSDSTDHQMMNQNQLNTGLPFGLEKMMGPLMKQLEKELSNLEKQNGGMPKNIKISFGNPNLMNMQKQQKAQKKQELPKVIVSDEEKHRRQKKKLNQKSKDYQIK
jgi:hypothetical protein